MIEIIEQINAYVMAKVPSVGSNINEDFFSADEAESVEVMCRHDPAPLIKRRYLTGCFWAEFNFSYYARAMDPITARQVLEAILAALSIDTFTELLGLSDGRIEITARPTPISQSESGAVIYTSSYRLVYFQEV